jgi:hypothetical protein
MPERTALRPLLSVSHIGPTHLITRTVLAKLLERSLDKTAIQPVPQPCWGGVGSLVVFSSCSCPGSEGC